MIKPHVDAILPSGRVFLTVGLSAALLSGLYISAKHANDLLLVVARKGIAPAVQPVLWLGANIVPDDIDHDPLWLAAYRGHSSTVAALLDSGSNVHSGQDLALRTAAEYGRSEVVRLLIARGAHVSALNDWALRHAANNGHVETVRVLLAAGANARALNNQALQWAIENGHFEVADALRQHPAIGPQPR